MFNPGFRIQVITANACSGGTTVSASKFNASNIKADEALAARQPAKIKASGVSAIGCYACEVGNDLVFRNQGQIAEKGHPRSMLADPQNPRTAAFLSKVL